jgi:hypothetical protein
MSVDSVKQKLDFDQFILIAEGHAAFQLLWAGVELGIFTHLSKEPGMTLEQIAQRLDLEHQPMRILLIGLAALRLVEKKGDTYHNAELTEKILINGKPGSIVPALGWQYHIVYKGLVDFVDSLKQNKNIGLKHFPGRGETLYERLESNPALERIFQDAMSALSKQANSYLLESADFSGLTHLVDVGGGDATNAIAFVRKYPKLKVTIFDSPSICEIAKKNIAAAALVNRIDTCPGDLFTDPFPSGIDSILYSHMFTIWSREKNIGILKKSYNALPQGGSVIIFNMMGFDDGTGPLSTALGSPYFMAIATGEGMLYSWKDYEAWIKESGFSRIKRVDSLPFDHGVLIGIK